MRSYCGAGRWKHSAGPGAGRQELGWAKESGKGSCQRFDSWEPQRQLCPLPVAQHLERQQGMEIVTRRNSYRSLEGLPVAQAGEGLGDQNHDELVQDPQSKPGNQCPQDNGKDSPRKRRKGRRYVRNQCNKGTHYKGGRSFLLPYGCTSTRTVLLSPSLRWLRSRWPCLWDQTMRS